MFKFSCYFLFFLYNIVNSNAGKATFITPCKNDDNACILSSARAAVPVVAAGLPNLGIKPSDPMKIDAVRSDDANLKLGFRNLDITGVSKAQIISIERDAEKQTIKMVLATPLHAKGQYDLKGKILILEAVGDGDFVIKTNKVVVEITLRYKTIEKNNNKYWKITGYDYTYDLVEKVDIRLDNLFNGNKQLAQPLNELLDKEWKLMVTELGDPLLKQVMAEYVDVIKKCLLALPVSELVI